MLDFSFTFKVNYLDKAFLNQSLRHQLDGGLVSLLSQDDDDDEF